MISGQQQQVLLAVLVHLRADTRLTARELKELLIKFSAV